MPLTPFLDFFVLIKLVITAEVKFMTKNKMKGPTCEFWTPLYKSQLLVVEFMLQ